MRYVLIKARGGEGIVIDGRSVIAAIGLPGGGCSLRLTEGDNIEIDTPLDDAAALLGLRLRAPSTSGVTRQEVSFNHRHLIRAEEISGGVTMYFTGGISATTMGVTGEMLVDALKKADEFDAAGS